MRQEQILVVTLQAGGGVDGVAQGRVLHALGAAQSAGHHRSSVNAYPDTLVNPWRSVNMTVTICFCDRGRPPSRNCSRCCHKTSATSGATCLEKSCIKVPRCSFSWACSMAVAVMVEAVFSKSMSSRE